MSNVYWNVNIITISIFLYRKFLRVFSLRFSENHRNLRLKNENMNKKGPSEVGASHQG